LPTTATAGKVHVPVATVKVAGLCVFKLARTIQLRPRSRENVSNLLCLTAQIVRHEDSNEFIKNAASGGKIFDWIKEHVRPTAAAQQYRPTEGLRKSQPPTRVPDLNP
jgi:hypothetical protein